MLKKNVKRANNKSLKKNAKQEREDGMTLSRVHSLAARLNVIPLHLVQLLLGYQSNNDLDAMLQNSSALAGMKNDDNSLSNTVQSIKISDYF